LVDHLATLLVLLGQSMPVFWTGIMLMLLFAVAWNLFPASGWDTWASTVLPAITLGTFQAPLFLRISRSAMLEVLGLDYVRTARAKGLKERVVIIKHALKNAAIPIVTVIGLQFGILLGGAVVTETVFAIPGTGRLIVRAIGQLDFPVVQAGVMTLALIIVLITMAVGRPFTLQYAREQVAPELWASPEFIRTNYVITAVWALAFAVLVIADLILLYRPDLSPRLGIFLTIAALVGAVKFTSWYPERKAVAGKI